MEKKETMVVDVSSIDSDSISPLDRSSLRSYTYDDRLPTDPVFDMLKEEIPTDQGRY